MKTQIPTVLLAGVLASGCAVQQPIARCGLALDPVGPSRMTAITANPDNGLLRVYSAYDVNPEFNSQTIYRPRYTDYQVLTVNGEPLKTVSYDSGTLDMGPADVELPAGQYKVVARANAYGLITAPVTVAAGQLTTVHLESDFAQAR